MDGYRMDRTLLTSKDMQMILAGLRSLDSISGSRYYGQLMEKIRQLQSETQQMERLIQQKEAQMKFYADLYEALDFVEFARKLYPADGGNVSYYDFIKDQMYFHQKDRVKDFPIRVSK
jgi:TolA-binding protein